MSITGVVHLEVETLVYDVPCKFGVYYRVVSGGPVTFVAKDMVNTFVAGMFASLKAVLSSSVRIMRVIGRPLDPADGNPYEANFDESHIGTGAAEAIAPSIALLIKMRTDSTSAKNNGHVYIAGVPEGVWVDGGWEPATFIPLVNTFISQLTGMAALSTSGAVVKCCVVSRFLAGVKRTPYITFDVVSSSVGARVSQQRRRQSGITGIHS